MTDLTTFMCRLSWNLTASASRNARGLQRDCFTLLWHVACQWTLYRYEHPSNSVIFTWISNFSAASAFHATLIFIIAQYKNILQVCGFVLADSAGESNLLNQLTPPTKAGTKTQGSVSQQNLSIIEPKSAKYFSFQRCFCWIYVGPTYCQIKVLHSTHHKPYGAHQGNWTPQRSPNFQAPSTGSSRSAWAHWENWIFASSGQTAT